MCKTKYKKSYDNTINQSENKLQIPLSSDEGQWTGLKP